MDALRIDHSQTTSRHGTRRAGSCGTKWYYGGGGARCCCAPPIAASRALTTIAAAAEAARRQNRLVGRAGRARGFRRGGAGRARRHDCPPTIQAGVHRRACARSEGAGYEEAPPHAEPSNGWPDIPGRARWASGCSRSLPYRGGCSRGATTTGSSGAGQAGEAGRVSCAGATCRTRASSTHAARTAGLARRMDDAAHATCGDRLSGPS